jgi:glycosyltransferase involved in cell wall biosynthesis
MNITVVQGAFLPVPTLRGGAVEKVWLGLGREFVRLGHQVTHVSRLCDELPQEEMCDGVRHLRVPGADAPPSLWRLKWQDLRFTRRVAALLDTLPRADVVVTNTFFAPLLLSPRRHGPLWVHVQRYPQRQMSLYRRAARLQTVSGVIARAIVAQSPRMAERVCVIPNPLPSVVTPKTSVIREPGLILFVGRLHPEKGVELLLEAFAQLRARAPQVRLRVVGPAEVRHGGGGEAFLARLRTLAAPHGDAVEFTGPVFDEAQLSAHFQAASVFVYPSLAPRGEASPVAPLEALARGLPVVLSDLECFDDLLPQGHACARRFDPFGAEAATRLAAALEPWAAAPGIPLEIVAAAAARADAFALPRIAARYLEGFAALNRPQHP